MQYIDADSSESKTNSLSTLALTWRMCSCLAVCLRPFIPSSDKLWKMLGNENDIDNVLLKNSMNIDSKLYWNSDKPTALFKKLDLENIVKSETSLSNSIDKLDDSVNNGGSDYINFEDFLKVEMKTGKIVLVEDHPNADKLYVITIEDAPDSTRKVCAGLKEYYTIEDLEGLNVAFVANLEPRKLRGITSEGMLLAADDGNGNVKLLTIDGDIIPGSKIR